MDSMATKIGERIKYRCTELGISQRLLAEKANIYQSQVSRYEQGEVEPTATALLALAQALHTSTDWLIGLVDEESTQKVGSLNPMEQQVLAFFRAKSPDRQPTILEILRLA